MVRGVDQIVDFCRYPSLYRLSTSIYQSRLRSSLTPITLISYVSSFTSIALLWFALFIVVGILHMPSVRVWSDHVWRTDFVDDEARSVGRLGHMIGDGFAG